MKNEEAEWIKFNIDKIRELKAMYLDAMDYIKDGLPDVNLNSRKDVLNFFNKTFNIELKSSRIKEISAYLKKYNQNSSEFEMILGIVYYFKMKYAIKNYLDCVLTHEKGGVVELREFFGQTVMPNRQPLPKSPEILECIIDHSGQINLKGE